MDIVCLFILENSYELGVYYGYNRKNLIDVLVKENNRYKNDNMIIEIENMEREYSKLVDEGYTQKRGYNLMLADKINTGNNFCSSVSNFV